LYRNLDNENYKYWKKSKIKLSIRISLMPVLLNIWFKYLPLQDKSKDSKANPLSVKNIGGVFVVLLAGLLGSIIVAVLEFCWNSRKVYPVKCIKFSRFQITKVLRIETLLFIYVTLFKCLFLFYWVQNIKVSITCYSQT
jgi:hypothetical protein